MKKKLFISIFIGFILFCLSSCSYPELAEVYVNNRSSYDVENIVITWITGDSENTYEIKEVKSHKKSDVIGILLGHSVAGNANMRSRFYITYEMNGELWDVKNSTTVEKIGDNYFDERAVFEAGEEYEIKISNTSYSIQKK